MWAVESIEGLFPLIEDLYRRGLAYRVPGHTDEQGVYIPR